MPATGSSTTTTSTRSRTSWPTRREWWASTRSRGSWTTLSARRGDPALRLLAPGLRGGAPEYGVEFDQHDARYARTAEWLAVVSGMWVEPRFSFAGKYYRVENAILEPKPVSRPRPTIYAGGESEAAKQLIAQLCDAYLMHGDPPERVATKVADMRGRRERRGPPPLKFGVAGYVVCRATAEAARREVARITDVRQSAAGYANYQEWLANTQLEQQVSLGDYSVSNRGLKAGLAGTPEQIAERILEFERAGVDLLLLQCSPQHDEMERFAEGVIPLVRPDAATTKPGFSLGAHAGTHRAVSENR